MKQSDRELLASLLEISEGACPQTDQLRYINKLAYERLTTLLALRHSCFAIAGEESLAAVLGVMIQGLCREGGE